MLQCEPICQHHQGSLPSQLWCFTYVSNPGIISMSQLNNNPVTRQSSFPDLPSLENFLKVFTYWNECCLPFSLKLCRILLGVLRDVQCSVHRDVHLSTSSVNLPWKREEVLHHDSSLGIHFMQHQQLPCALPVLLLCWEQLHQRGSNVSPAASLYEINWTDTSISLGGRGGMINRNLF